MESLMIVGATKNAKDKVTSLELLKQINFFREEESLAKGADSVTMLRHDTLLSIIRDEFEDEISLQKLLESNYTNERGRSYPKFELTLDQAKQVLVRESKFVRKAVIAYIGKLEEALKATQPKVPATFREALLLAAEQQEVIEKQQLQLTEQAPKVDFYESVTGSNDTIDMASVAKVLNMGVGRNKLFDILRNERVLMQTNAPYQNYIDMGWFRQVESKYNKPNGDTCINIKTVVFQKGVEGIRKILKRTNKETK